MGKLYIRQRTGHQAFRRGGQVFAPSWQEYDESVFTAEQRAQIEADGYIQIRADKPGTFVEPKAPAPKRDEDGAPAKAPAPKRDEDGAPAKAPEAKPDTKGKG